MPACRWSRVYGMPNPDWVIGTTEDGKTCKDMAGQDVGVDSIGGARSVALRSMLAAGCKEVKIDQVKQVALGSSPGPALIAGRLHYAVLHLDDLAEIEHQGKKLNILLAMKNTNPTSHYLMLVVRKDNLAKNRDAIVRTVAGADRGRAFHAGPEERRRGGGRGRGDRPQQGGEQAEALKEFLAIDFWAAKDDGLPRNKLEASRHADEEDRRHQARQGAGDLRQLVDPSVWKDANAMVK